MSNMANLSKEGLVIVAMISGVFMAVLLGMGMMKTVFGDHYAEFPALVLHADLPKDHNDYWFVGEYPCEDGVNTYEHNFTKYNTQTPDEFQLEFEFAQKVNCSEIVLMTKHSAIKIEEFADRIEKATDKIIKATETLKNQNITEITQ